MTYSATVALAILQRCNQDGRATLNERTLHQMVHALARPRIEVLVFGDKHGLPLVLFPTSGARYYENKIFGLVGALAWHIENGKPPFTARTRQMNAGWFDFAADALQDP